MRLPRLGVSAVALTCLLALPACSGGPSSAELAQASSAAASSQASKDAASQQQKAQASLSAQVKKLQADASSSSSSSSSASSSSAAASAASSSSSSSSAAKATSHRASQGTRASSITSCGGNLSVGVHTSCGFAANVESAFYQAGGGDNDIEAYSPTTGRYYQLHCRAGAPSVCRTPDGAVVYIR